MTKNYTQLSLVQRYQIEAFIKSGLKKNVVEYLGVNPSTNSRELKMNTPQRGRKAKTYLATNAQRKTDLRHHLKPKFVKFNESMKEQAVNWLTVDKWSPELISFRGN